MTARVAPSTYRLLFLFGLILLAVVSTVPATAQTMLTNGSEYFVQLPAVPDTGQRRDELVNGDNGFMVFVPPGANRLVVQFTSVPGETVELLVAHGADVGTNGIGNRVADYRTFADNRGIATIDINNQIRTTLKAGLYFIGFFVNVPDTAFTGVLLATFEGPGVDPNFVAAQSNFENGLDGWTRNSTASPIPGTNVGHAAATLDHFAEGGNPGGYARIRAIANAPDEWFIAPDKFHVNLLELVEPRIEFDVARFTGSAISNFNVEVRVFSANGGYSWSLQPAPPIPSELDPFTNTIKPIWQRVSVPIRDDLWRRVSGSGDDFYQTVFSEVARIEVRGTFSLLGGSSGIDNFRIVGRGDPGPLPVLPGITSFSAGLDRWASNFPAVTLPGATAGEKGSALVWNELEGNPGGMARLFDNGGDAPDAFVLPADYLGDYSALDGPRFEFDYFHRSTSGATDPVQIRLISSDGTVYTWTGVVPAALWGRQVAPLAPGQWTLTAGETAFEDILKDVVRVEISADQTAGAEQNAIDNFSLLTNDSPPLLPALTAAPATLNFSAVVATAPIPEPATVQLTSSGQTIHWEAELAGELADRITLSSANGQTPDEITITISGAGLAEGTYEAEITFYAVGLTIEPSVVGVALTMQPQPVPTPVISDKGVVHAATNQDRLAPGALGTIYGKNFGGPAAGMATNYVGRNQDLLPNNVDGIRVLVYTFSGVLIAEAPILYIDDKQINFQMPFDVAGQAVVRVVVSNNGAAGPGQTVQIQPSAPGIFLHAGNRAVATNQDGTLNTNKNPSPRRTVMTVYMTGQGNVTPQWPTGKAASGFPLIYAPSEAHALIGGVEARIQFLGLAPGMVGVLQLNVFPVWETPLGDQPLEVNIGGYASNLAVVSIK